MIRSLKIATALLAIVMLASVGLLVAYQWQSPAWHGQHRLPESAGLLITAIEDEAVRLFSATENLTGTRRLDLRRATPADAPLKIYGMGMGTAPVDITIVPRSAAERIVTVRRAHNQGLHLSGSADGAEGWSVSLGLLVESFVDGQPYSSVLLGTREALLDGRQTNVPSFGPARNSFVGNEINIASLVPADTETVLRFSVITLDAAGAVSDLFLTTIDVNLP